MKQSGVLVHKVFELLKHYPDGLTFKEISEGISGSRHEPTSDLAIEDLRRACLGPLHAEWLIFKGRNKLSLTKSGEVAYARYKDPSELMAEAGKHSVRSFLSVHFPMFYNFACNIKDNVTAELKATRRVGLKCLFHEKIQGSTVWDQILPIQKPRHLNVTLPNGTSLREHFVPDDFPFAEGGHAIYLPPESFRKSILHGIAADYPIDAGIKIIKNKGRINESSYVRNIARGDSRLHLKLIHSHRHLTLVANLLFTHGLGARLYDLVELQCGEKIFIAYIIQHIGGGVPSISECEAGIRGLRDLEQRDLIRVITPLGFKDEEFECPTCGGNAVTNEQGQFRYIDFQNFMLVKYDLYLRRVAIEATKASHFGDQSILRGGQYLYQSVPGVNLPGKRNVEARIKVLEKLMGAADVSINGRLVLDVGCNIGMMMAQYLRLGAFWCHGWDRSAVINHTERLLSALGCTRFSTTGGEIVQSKRLENDLPSFLKPHIKGCVVSYLAVREHLGWLETLARIPWVVLIYEGHEGETRADFEQHMVELQGMTRFRIGGITEYSDGDCDKRTLSILIRM